MEKSRPRRATIIIYSRPQSLHLDKVEFGQRCAGYHSPLLPSWPQNSSVLSSSWSQLCCQRPRTPCFLANENDWSLSSSAYPFMCLLQPDHLTWPGSAFSVDLPGPSFSNSLQRSNPTTVYHSLPLQFELIPTPQWQLIKWGDQDQRKSARSPWGHVKLNTKLGTSGSGQQEWVYWEPLRNEESVTQLSRDKESRQRWAGLCRSMKMELKSSNKSIKYWSAIRHVLGTKMSRGEIQRSKKKRQIPPLKKLTI